jgi:hypothetical protein
MYTCVMNNSIVMHMKPHCHFACLSEAPACNFSHVLFLFVFLVTLGLEGDLSLCHCI